MQLRAYELWIQLLGRNSLPSIAELRPSDHPMLAPFGVVLDFTRSRSDPNIDFLGEQLACECGVRGVQVGRVSDLPERSLLARIAEHYLLAILSHVPIGFEAECVNQRDQTILYRGILLPFMRDRPTIDYVFGVINWKELAGENITGELLLELRQVLDREPEEEAGLRDERSSFTPLPSFSSEAMKAAPAPAKCEG